MSHLRGEGKNWETLVKFRIQRHRLTERLRASHRTRVRPLATPHCRLTAGPLPWCVYPGVCIMLKVKVKSLSHIQLFATQRTVAYYAPPSMGFSRQEYWSGLPFPSPRDLPDPGIESRSPALQADALPLSHQGSPVSCEAHWKAWNAIWKGSELLNRHGRSAGIVTPGV